MAPNLESQLHALPVEWLWMAANARASLARYAALHTVELSHVKVASSVNS
jgi:hypothetical protein